MKKQAVVIGLGQFGMSIARSLSQRGLDVLGVDLSEERVRLAAGFLADVAAFDASNSDALVRTSPQKRDICVCTIGEESREASIICTALLRQMGAPRIIARANNDLHARILLLVGAHQVVNPEREFGDRFASQLLHENITGEMRLGDDLVITEFLPPKSFVGKSLLELQLPKSFGITVIAVRPRTGGSVLLPDPAQPLKPDDLLVVVSREVAVANLMERS